VDRSRREVRCYVYTLRCTVWRGMRGRRDGDDHSIYASEGGRKPNKTPRGARAFRAGEGRGKSLKKNCGFEIFSFFSCPSARRSHPYCCERKLRNRRMRGGNFRDNCENTMHRRVRELREKADVYNENGEFAERSAVNESPCCLAAP
jgi:hypothetical protein